MVPKPWDSVKPLCLKQLGHALTFPVCFSIPNTTSPCKKTCTHFIYENISNIPFTKYFLFGWEFFLLL